MNYLKKIQNQPERKRKSLMALFIILGGVIIIIIWFFLFPSSVKKGRPEKDWVKEAINEMSKENANKNFFGSFKENIDRLTNKKLLQDEEKTVKDKRLPVEK